MLKKWEKIEDKLNSSLAKLGVMLVALWFKLVPKPVLNFIENTKNKIIKTFNDFINWLNTKGEQIHNYIKAKRQAAKEAPSLKLRANEKVTEIRLFLLKTPLRSRAGQIANALTATIEKLSKVPLTQFAIAIGAMGMISFGTYSVYTSSQNIYMQEWGSRAPASADRYLDRPEYRKFPDRTLKVFNVKIPVYVESVSSVQSVTVDFTVRTDTRFARKFLEEYEYKLKDYFFMTTEPMVSTFPLEDEGKWVIKEKIMDELNIFLENENVEGEVLEVDIIFIVGS